MKPIIGITMGDPASIGPEISVKALCHEDLYDRAKPIIIGDACVMARAARILGMDDSKIHMVKSIDEARFVPGTIDVLDLGLVNADQLMYGKVSALAGEAAFQYVIMAIDLAERRIVDATVTNALSKEAIHLAGHHYSGHTEIYAEYTGTRHYTMMLAHETLRVVHVSTHVSLREACERVKKTRVLEVIRIAHDACRRLGIAEPRIGVAGLNPHSGENGLFGREEIDEIIPAIAEAREEGMTVDGPVPPDTVFSKAIGGWYDIVVTMYHDQGHIPVKVKGFVYDAVHRKWQAVAGVNITLGLPIFRTSVDHGTAFDQVGSGQANELSLLNAIDYAVRMAQGQKR